MSWTHTFTLDLEKIDYQIGAEIERLFDFASLQTVQPNATETQVNAAKAAVKLLGAAISVPPEHVLNVVASGHTQALAPGSGTDFLSVQVGSIQKKFV